MRSTISSWALMIARALEAQGVDSERLFRAAGLDPAKLHEPGARYPTRGLDALWRHAVEATADPGFGFAVARQWHPTTFHGLGYAWLASPTMLEGLRRLDRYFRVITNASWMSYRRASSGYALTIEQALDPDLNPTYPAVDAALMTFLVMCRAVAGEDFAPLLVQLARPAPNDVERFEDAFGAPVRFGQLVDGMVVDHADVERDLPYRNRELALAAEEVLERYLAQVDDRGLASRVRVAIAEALPSGEVSQERVASALHVSVRTLQRRLRDEGTTFRDVLEETRRDLALRYVGAGAMTLGEITFMLGFSEPSNLTRAFRRWTGHSPRAWRERIAAQA